MIPADHISFGNDDTAWLVVECPPVVGVEVIRITVWDTNARRTFRVSVVHDMVLPIVGWDPEGYGDERVVRERAGTHDTPWALSPENIGITLPPAATPGMFAVKLQVHS